MAVGNHYSLEGRFVRIPSREEVEFIPHQIAEGIRYGLKQDVFLILDLDETTFTGCLKKHDRAYRLWASLRGHQGALPEYAEVQAAGRARIAFSRYLENASCLEDRMRGATVAHQLEPMHPQLQRIASEMQAQNLRPALSITARPKHLEAFSRKELTSATNLDIPVFAMPADTPLSDAGRWKVEQLSLIKRQLQRKKRLRPIVIFDDSPELFRLIQELGDPDIFCVRYEHAPKLGVMEANWETLPETLRQIRELWQDARQKQPPRLR